MEIRLSDFESNLNLEQGKRSKAEEKPFSKAVENETFPFLICGAGPVGLFLAACLGMQGKRVLLIEKRQRPSKISRAIGILPPSLSLFDHLGLLPEVLSKGEKLDSILLHGTKYPLGTFTFQGLKHSFPFAISLPQWKTEAILEAKLASLPSVTLIRDCELLSFQEQLSVNSQDELLVKCNIGTLRTRWIIGCDGERSIVRQLASIAFASKSTGDHFVMADTVSIENLNHGVDFDLQRRAALFFTQRGALESFPLPDGKRRWIAQLNSQPKHSNSEGDPRELLSQSIAERSGYVIDPNHLENPSFFRPHRGIANKFCHQHILLCGDAAHVMSPIGGQGMNLGFMDAFELAQVFSKQTSDVECGSDIDLKILEHWAKTRKNAAIIAMRRAKWNTWIGTRNTWASSFIRNILLWVYLRFLKAWKAKERFSMLDLPVAHTYVKSDSIPNTRIFKKKIYE